VGKRTLVFNFDYSVELQVPLQQLTIGDDCIVTTFAQLGNSHVKDGLWMSHNITVGSGCLLGNNSIIDTAGLPLPDNTWVSALSHVTSDSVAAAATRPHHALGTILCGNPVATPMPVTPSTLLSSSSATLMHPFNTFLLSCIWTFMLAPALCPSSMEVLVVFFLVLNTQWSFSSMLLLLICCEAGAFIWSSICLTAFERISSRIVVNGAQYHMFTEKWWIFHWCDMFRARYISLWPQFFSDSPVFAWFMRAALGARCGADVTISEPHLSEPGLQTIGDGSVIAWNSWLQPHTYNGHTLILGSVSVGSYCFIDSHAALLPESAMNDGSSLLPVTLLMKGDRVESNQCYEGVPARATA
jgi:carbonic anhydrase/acetyltransferase-like protein (isoleucine patch superfamily)